MGTATAPRARPEPWEAPSGRSLLPRRRSGSHGGAPVPTRKREMEGDLRDAGTGWNSHPRAGDELPPAVGSACRPGWKGWNEALGEGLAQRAGARRLRDTSEGWDASGAGQRSWSRARSPAGMGKGRLGGDLRARRGSAPRGWGARSPRLLRGRFRGAGSRRSRRHQTRAWPRPCWPLPAPHELGGLQGTGSRGRGWIRSGSEGPSRPAHSMIPGAPRAHPTFPRPGATGSSLPSCARGRSSRCGVSRPGASRPCCGSNRGPAEGTGPAGVLLLRGGGSGSQGLDGAGATSTEPLLQGSQRALPLQAKAKPSPAPSLGPAP